MARRRNGNELRSSELWRAEQQTEVGYQDYKARAIADILSGKNARANMEEAGRLLIMRNMLHDWQVEASQAPNIREVFKHVERAEVPEVDRCQR